MNQEDVQFEFMNTNHQPIVLDLPPEAAEQTPEGLFFDVRCCPSFFPWTRYNVHNRFLVILSKIQEVTPDILVVYNLVSKVAL